MPFALVEKSARGPRLAAVNAAGRSFGLAPGQRLADARARIPDLLSERHEAAEDAASLLGLCRWMERYTPWAAPDGTDGLLLDATGIPHLFGGEDAMLAGMRGRLARYGFTARTAIAGTIGAAWGLARWPAETLEALPVEALRIGAAEARALRRLGLKTVGALRDIPRASLARRFRGEAIHENVLIRLDEMFGQRNEPLNPLNPPSSFVAHRALAEPAITHEGIEAVLEGLVRALSRDLDRASRGATRIILKLFRTDGSRIALPAGFSAPAAGAAHMLRILKPKLATVDAGFGIDAMTLEARETAPAIIRQMGFMDETAPAAIAELDDRIANRHETALGRLEAVESHVPERAERLRPASCPAPPHTPAAGQPADRPLLVFERPERAAVIAAVPDGPPMRFTWRRVTRKVARAEGPERIAPEWWRPAGGGRPRDYYRIEDEEGRRYWLYREGLYDGEDGAPPIWFVHGLSA